jgi:hypothetical protein
MLSTTGGGEIMTQNEFAERLALVLVMAGYAIDRVGATLYWRYWRTSERAIGSLRSWTVKISITPAGEAVMDRANAADPLPIRCRSSSSPWY